MDQFSRRKSFSALVGAPLLAAIPAVLAAKTETVTGILVDIGSYQVGRPAREYTGPHARACCLEGFVQGILTSDKKLYQVVGDYAANANAKLLPIYMSASVTATGEVSEKEGRMTIAATDIKPGK